MSDEEQLPEDLPANALAIVGIGVHAPGALDREAFWANLVAGSVLSELVGDEELAKAGVSERERKNPRYVRRTYRLPSMREFEPEFFGLTPRDAALTDPQTRHLLECCWEALEDAAIDPARPTGPIGLFVGTGFNAYLFGNLLPDREIVDTYGRDKLLQLGNDRDYVAARIAYSLDLRGPTTGVAASCATGSLSVHLACQSLLGRECRIALAGAASINLPHGTGYMYEEGGISSPDGVCRSFDAAAQGTLPSSGSGVLALMRLEDALREGRDIYACVLATAYNNDGRRKVGFAAPSVDGPLSAIEEALAVAGVDARTIGYVEAHGTATAFGDSIEISALTQAFRQTTPDVGFCVLGTNKPNIGHTDAASGVLSVIKAASALSARTLPPLSNFVTPHPMLDLARSPFRIVTERAPWSAPNEGPRRALVNCLAVGGSNVHIVLEEAPAPLHQSADDGTPQLLALSARSAEALGAMQRRLADHLEHHPELALRDVAYTLRAGRHLFDVRKALVVSSREDAIAQLRGESARDVSAVPELVRLIELARRFVEDREPSSDEGGTKARFVHLPGYPFERRTLWTEARGGALTAAALPTPRGGELPHARVKYVHCDPSIEQPSPEQRFLVFVDDTGLGEQVVARLRARGCPVIAARLGSGQALTQVDEANYRIDCDRGFEGPSTLIGELFQSGRMPDVILLLWTVTTEERFRTSTNRFHHDMERGYFTLLALCQGLAALESSRPLRVVAVTNDALGAGSETVQFPAKTLVFGPIAALPLEQPNVTALAIDINVPVGLKRALIVPQLLTRMHDRAAAALLPEAVGRSNGIYALRGNQLLQRTLESVPARRFEGRFPPLRPGAAYVVLGGFGNLGYALAEQLATHGKIRLVLIGRTPIPDRVYWDEWLRDHGADDPVSERIEKVRALEGRGMEVLALGADVCHLESLGSALSQARRRFGKLQGVIHAAGSLSEALCGGESLDEARDALAAEVLGVRVLDELTRHDELDFVVTLGNATRFSPRAGTYARNAASEFGEAYTDFARGRLRSYDLGLVRDGGMFVRWIRQLEAEGPIHDPQVLAVMSEIDRGLSTQETARAVLQALGSNSDRQLVIGPVPRPSLPRSAGGSSFNRSELKREYLAPEGELERKLAAFWAEALHIDRIGASDDFFELGGHSLIAVRLGVRIKSTWGVTVPLATIIEAPTVRQLAAVIQEHLSLRGTRDTQLLREWTTIVPLQPRGQRPPLFCVGGKGGNVMNLRHLATLLGREQPAFGLQARGVDGSAPPHTTIEAQVEEYLSDVQRVRAKGPYLLSGFSGGGAMILEMARRLRAQGHVVGPLLFFDAWNPAAPGRDLGSKLRGHAGLFRELGPRYAQMFTERWVRYRAQELLRAAAPAVADRIWEPPVALGAVADAWDVAIADYHPAPYEGNAVLFRVRADRSRGELDFSEDEQNGWGGVILGGIEIIDVPGSHTSIVEEPHVRALAQSVQGVLERALRRLGDDERNNQPPSRVPPASDDTHDART
jgi:3-oxoacyl-(acyl-carrier-protein) synthase/thioesterase domain-containing protein/acyl carrier protein